MSELEFIGSIWAWLTGFLPSWLVGILTALLIYIFFPDKVERAAIGLVKPFAWIQSSLGKRYVAFDITSRVNRAANRLGKELEGVLPYSLSIKWVGVDAVEAYVTEGKVLVMMRRYDNQSKNVAYATKAYVEKALLPNARRYVDPTVESAIDCVVCKQILQDSPDSVETYSKEIMHPEMDRDPDLKDWVIRMDQVNAAGHLTRILLREYQRLGSLYPLEPSAQTYDESRKAADMLHRLATKESGEEVNPSLAGTYIEMTVVPTVKKEAIRGRDPTGVQRQLDFIMRSMAEEGVNRFYVVAAGGTNIGLARYLVQEVAKLTMSAVVSEEEYTGSHRGQRMRLYCALIEAK